MEIEGGKGCDVPEASGDGERVPKIDPLVSHSMIHELRRVRTAR
jgi:hypothetical protein